MEGAVQLKISGYDVQFPFKPYASQLGVMSKVLKAADGGENALLESPTGSGKSLALLCSALAWQERWKSDQDKGQGGALRGGGGGGVVEVDDDGWIVDKDADASASASASASAGAVDEHDDGGAGPASNDEGYNTAGAPSRAPSRAATNATKTSASGAPAAKSHANANADANANATNKKPAKVPRIYYATRTHSQIAQVVRELKRTSYRPSMVVLGSRDHYCIHKTVRARGRNIAEECKNLLESGASKAGGGCSFSHGALKLAGNAQRTGAEPVGPRDKTQHTTR